MSHNLFIVVLFLYGVNNIKSARILAVFPTPSYSHQVVFRSLTRELAHRGHEVVVLTTDPAYPKEQTPPNLTEIDVHDLSYDFWKNQLLLATGKRSDMVHQVMQIYTKLSYVVEKQFRSTEVQKLVKDKNKQFDLLILELVPRLASGYAHIYKVPIIYFSSFGAIRETFEIMGSPTHSTLYQVPSCHRVYNLTFWEKISEIYTKLLLQYYVYNDLYYLDNMLVRKSFGRDAPDIMELRTNNSLVFLNTHNLWTFNRPLPINIINLSGIHQYETKELPKDLQNYLDNSKNGVIYISFGTNSKPSSFPINTINIFTKVFAQLPYNILLKWDEDELYNRTKNVKIVKWVPQSDLLRHPNIKLFVTQGGLQSTEEAITAQVPLVTLPLLADQWYNSEMCTFYKIGITLNLETLTEYNFKNAIDTIMEDPSYKENIVKLRTLMKDEAQPALDRAVWWTEYVLKYGTEHLRSPAFNMPWTEYYELELVIIVIFSFIIALMITKILLNYLISKVVKFRKVTFKNKCF